MRTNNNHSKGINNMGPESYIGRKQQVTMSGVGVEAEMKYIGLYWTLFVILRVEY